MKRVVLLGVSTRALAESAARAGHEVVAADFFGDRDQARVCESYALDRDLGLPLTAEGLATAASRLGADAVVYGANLENHPEVIASLSDEVRVVGNDAATVAQVRGWASLRRVCARVGIPAPETLLPGEERLADNDVRWLRKRRRSGGGHGVGRWRGGALDAQHLLQREVPGRPASISFVADGRTSRVLALSEQLIGRRPLGARGYTWCGNLLPFEAPSDEAQLLLAQAERMATKLTGHYGLRGLNGLDCIVARDADGAPRLWLIEINPRFTGSMELVEKALGIGLFELHVAGCEGRLPQDSAGGAPARRVAKGIVYARRAITAPDTAHWYRKGRRDIPRSGLAIGHGHPVCSVFSSGADREECLESLWRRAAAVYGEIEVPGSGTVGVAESPCALAPVPPRGQAEAWSRAQDKTTTVSVRTLVRPGVFVDEMPARDIEEVERC